MKGRARKACLTIAPETLGRLRTLGLDPASIRYAIVTRGPQDLVTGLCL